MGATLSSEPDAEILSTVKQFVEQRLHFSRSNIFTSFKDILDTAVRMHPQIDTDEIKKALMTIIDPKYVRYSIDEDEPCPDILLNHCLMDMDTLTPQSLT